jgi:acyl carrier protein
VPLFSALLNYRHGTQEEGEALAGWKGIEQLATEFRNNYPLTLSVDDLGDGFLLTAPVQKAVGAERVCGFMRTALSNLADALERAPSTPVRNVEVLPPLERRRLLEEWNHTAANYVSDKYIRELEVPLAEGGEPIMRGYVLDHWLRPAPVGVLGELYIGADGLRGSVGQPGLTAAQFLPDPFGSGARLYRARTLARWRADGVLEFVERAERLAHAVAPAARAYEAPRTPVEEVIAGIWSEMLGVERIGVHDNFFILGGHSLLATRVIARLREAFEVELPLRALFEAPRMGELSERVEMLCWAKWATETKTARSDQTEEIGVI